MHLIGWDGLHLAAPGISKLLVNLGLNDNDNDNDKVFYSTLIIHFISHITVINAFAY